MVDNPSETSWYRSAEKSKDALYDYVIITNEALETTFQTLADHKTGRGVRATIKTVEDIYSEYSGVDDPDKIRNFIIDAYQVYEARAAGADALLLIVAALEDDQLKDLQSLTRDMGMHALVEVHNQSELLTSRRRSPSTLYSRSMISRRRMASVSLSMSVLVSRSTPAFSQISTARVLPTP